MFSSGWGGQNTFILTSPAAGLFTMMIWPTTYPPPSENNTNVPGQTISLEISEAAIKDGLNIFIELLMVSHMVLYSPSLAKWWHGYNVHQMQDAWHQLQVFNPGITAHPACEPNYRDVSLMYGWCICWCFTQKPQSHYSDRNTSACMEKTSCVFPVSARLWLWRIVIGRYV